MDGRLFCQRTFVAALAAVTLCMPTAGAQDLTTVERPTAMAAPISEAPTIDGDVLNDPAWVEVTPTSGFIQKTPDTGQPASEKTEVYIAYTGDTLYFGVVCYDREPDRIVVADSRRDSELEETDSFQIIIDTYRDEQTGFVFGTNPVGIEYDGQVTREGEGSSFSAGGFNKNWDAVWQVSAQISEIGWSAEFAIPFTTLRYPRSDEQVWTLNMQRNIRRHNEQSFWSPIPVQFQIYRLALAGSVEGLRVPSQRNLKLLPYVLGEVQTQTAETSKTDTNFEFGIDLKYSITPSLTLDATYNTDFAQVEVDDFQINLNRFNIFFPEKRPFFLENAGYFSVGVPKEVELFFSRRIGIGPDGEVVPIIAGARTSGKLAQRYNLGALYMRTEAVPGVMEENSFAVARLSRDFPNRSYIGGIVVSRKGHGPDSEDDYNHALSLDGRWGIGQYGLVQGFVAKTETPGADQGEHAFRLGANYDSPRWSYSASYTEVAPDFNPEVGFLTRRGYRKPSFFVMRRIRPENLLGLLEIRPHASYNGYWDFDGFQETGFLHLDTHWEWRSSWEVHTGINFTREGVKEPFEIYPDIWVSPGTYDNVEAQIVFYTNRGAPVSFNLHSNFGGFFGGDRVSVSPNLRFRIGETFNAELGWSFNDIDLPEGAFRANLGKLRLSYSFTTLINLQALIQYNDRDDIWGANLRFAWLRTANSGLYVVFNQNQDIYSSGYGWTRTDRSFIVKYTYLFDLLK